MAAEAAKGRLAISRSSVLSLSGFLQLGLSTLIFLAAASGAKAWALNPSLFKMVGTLVLYTLGNMIMLRLVREFGMGAAFSLSAVIQLIAVNVVAFAVFGEKVGAVEAVGLALAVAAVAVISLGPGLTGR